MPTESKPIELGSRCPSFQLRGVDEKFHTQEDYISQAVLVVGFTCNHCPYVRAYEKRLNHLAREMKSNSVAFICINANDATSYPEDSFEKMKERSKAFAFQFDYLWDESQQTAKAFNAACTPEFFVYDKNRLLCYHGRFDDNHQDEKAVQKTYLTDAIQDLLGGQKVKTPQTSAIGCSIKWKA